jgi:hypothetical protein
MKIAEITSTTKYFEEGLVFGSYTINGYGVSDITLYFSERLPNGAVSEQRIDVPIGIENMGWLLRVLVAMSESLIADPAVGKRATDDLLAAFGSIRQEGE